MLDPIPTSILKQCTNEVTPNITRPINALLTTGEMPSKYKSAIITPILKKPGAECIYKNYRPVSNLTYASKLIEKAVFYQMNEHSDLHKLAETNQSAYHSKHSTATALLKIFNDVLLELDERNVEFLTLLNLSAAFDTVKHNILHNRLRHIYGYSGMALKWFTSYLSQRKQRVLINGALSSERT